RTVHLVISHPCVVAWKDVRLLEVERIDDAEFGTLATRFLLVDADHPVGICRSKMELDRERRSLVEIWITEITDNCGERIGPLVEFALNDPKVLLETVAVAAENE